MVSPSIINLILGAIIALTKTTSVFAQNSELTYTIAEERPPMTPIGNVLEDSNIPDLVPPQDIRDLRFSFLSEGNPQASYLWVNATSGELRTFSRIDREATCPRQPICELSVQTVVQAQLGAFFKIITVKVTIEDINDNTPTFIPSTYTVKIPENESPGQSFALPVAIDPDMGTGNSVIAYDELSSALPFSLLVNGSPASSFDIRIRLDAVLDRETTSSYQMRVRAVDGGSPRLTGTLTVKIEVGDINDNSPIFEQQEYTKNISESTTVDSVVVTVKANDRDAGENGQVTYFMPATQEDNVVFTMFQVNDSSGEVRAKIPLDSYAGRTYRLTIEAQDGGPAPRSARTDVVISVLDTQNSDPEILLNVFGVGGLAQVSELAELGRVVAHVRVSDPDSSLSPNGHVTCFLETNSYFELQAMDVDQYKVILTRRLDREQEAFHSVTVVCEDAGTPPLNATANFIVEVEDENDSPPVFESSYYTADVTEGTLSGSAGEGDVVVTVRATDADTGVNAQIVYRLADGSDSDFGIYTDGSIVVTNPQGVDREDKVKGAVRELTVLAVDGGRHPLTGTTTVLINIRDINDNAPKFSEPMYYFNIVEGARDGKIVNNVTATDADLESNAIFYFKMDDRDVNRVPFEVGLGGVITVSGEIDRETKANYEFRVIAYDLGQPVPLSSTVTVHIKVLDINDNAPVFVFPNENNYTLYVAHTLTENTAFASILATDADEGKNADLVYARDSGNGSKFFDIVSDSGQVVLVRPLSAKELGLHILAVVAHDQGETAQMATQSMLHIIVYEGNATLAHQDDGLGFRNIVVVIVLVVVTVVLALAILLTILLIRRVDKQRRLYNAKAEEAKVDSNLTHLNPCSSSDLESPTALSDPGGDMKDGGKKKKEVSFSLDEDNNINTPQTLTTFSPVLNDKYDAIPEKDRGKLKNDMMSTNHFQPDKHNKSSGAKKDVNNFNFHQVHPVGSGVLKNRQITDHVHHDDNLSDASGDVSTSDSGRGGSDVELQSHGGASKDSGDTSFASQRGFNPHNNLSMNINSSNNMTSGSGSTSSMKTPSNKSVHFQNIRPDPMGLGSFLSPITPGSAISSRPPRPPHHPSSSLSNRGPNSSSRYTPTTFSEEDGSYVKLANGNNGRRSNPSNHELELHRNRVMSDNFLPNQNSRHMSSTNPGGEYMDMTGIRSSYMSQNSNNSNSGLDGAGNWDADTTTSGSYTVDPQELCDEIDKLFFDEIQDVVV